MNNSKKNRSHILTQGIKDAVATGNKLPEKNNLNSKVLSAQEVASVFAQDEIEMLMANYKCLDTTPRALEYKLNEEVIGQEDAISLVAHVVYFNQKANFLEEVEGESPRRLNLLLVGPTGSGKTSIYNALRKNIDIPVIKYSADSITSAGYIGNKVENILARLFEEAKCDLPLAERGIIFIDEIDKKCTQAARDGGRDINGKAVQEELLKILEPNIIDVPLPNKKVIQFDTSRLTVIMMGAFVGLDDIKRKRLIKNSLGFKSLVSDMKEEEIEKEPYLPKDFIEFGFIPEFVGRAAKMIGVLKKLKKDKILELIFHGKNSPYVENTRFLANVLNVEQQISIRFLEKIAEELEESDTGVRDLESKITNLFYPIIKEAFEHPNEYGICIIDEEGCFSLEYDDVTYYG
ncbi:MAG: AAA family ATPase [Clostridia bacterium]|nr:AAA family ATPase [Clostridia bacterium]